MSDPGDPTAGTVYAAVGGQRFFDELVDHFYRGVRDDPVLRPMYVDDDLTEARRHLAGFLAQYWGGPPAYSAERGHPRLRMRHAPFPIDPAARDAWLAHMTEAVRAMAPPAEIERAMLEYFAMAADHLVNQA
ncbi:MAG: globin [Acidimicrobiales bacterium]